MSSTCPPHHQFKDRTWDNMLYSWDLMYSFSKTREMATRSSLRTNKLAWGRKIWLPDQHFSLFIAPWCYIHLWYLYGFDQCVDRCQVNNTLVLLLLRPILKAKQIFLTSFHLLCASPILFLFLRLGLPLGFFPGLKGIDFESLRLESWVKNPRIFCIVKDSEMEFPEKERW